MKNSSLILGFFDGVHVAHQVVIKSGLSDNSVLVTFKNSPNLYFQGHAEYILSREESLKKIYALGIKQIIELDFPTVVNWTADEYLQYLVKTYAPLSISTGYNHTFGLNQTGNANFLKLNQSKYGYKYFCIPPQKDGDDVISSTLIKKLLLKGDIERANKLLNSNFILNGKIIKGEKVARTMGFPTANFTYPQNIIKIPFGVYVARVFDKPAILNWGIKPTFNNTKNPILELHIPHFNKDLYNKSVRVEILKKIRDEKKFSGIDDLKKQIEKDIMQCLEL